MYVNKKKKYLFLYFEWNNTTTRWYSTYTKKFVTNVDLTGRNKIKRGDIVDLVGKLYGFAN